MCGDNNSVCVCNLIFWCVKKKKRGGGADVTIVPVVQ